MTSTKSKFLQFVDHRVRVTIEDGRQLVGTFLAFDKHLNVVLRETEEFRTVKSKKGDDRQIRRAVGMIILRGENVISISVEAPPSTHKKNEVGQGIRPTAQQVQTGQPAPQSTTQQNIQGVPIVNIAPTETGVAGIMPPSLNQNAQLPPQLK